MCERKDAQRAQDAAADALTAACLDCISPVSRALRKVYSEVLAEGVPDDLKSLVERLQ